MRQSETLAQKQGSKLQSQDEQLKKQRLEIFNLKKKMKEDKNKKFNSVAGNIRPKQSESKVKNTKIWKEVQHKLSDAIVTKEAIQTIEFDLQRLMAERKDAETNNSDSDHIQYLNERIEEAQTQLCDLEGWFSYEFFYTN